MKKLLSVVALGVLLTACGSQNAETITETGYIEENSVEMQSTEESDLSSEISPAETAYLTVTDEAKLKNCSERYDDFFAVSSKGYLVNEDEYLDYIINLSTADKIRYAFIDGNTWELIGDVVEMDYNENGANLDVVLKGDKYDYTLALLETNFRRDWEINADDEIGYFGAFVTKSHARGIDSKGHTVDTDVAQMLSTELDNIYNYYHDFTMEMSAARGEGVPNDAYFDWFAYEDGVIFLCFDNMTETSIPPVEYVVFSENQTRWKDAYDDRFVVIDEDYIQYKVSLFNETMLQSLEQYDDIYIDGDYIKYNSDYTSDVTPIWVDENGFKHHGAYGKLTERRVLGD